jgi:hypothetical protein
MLLVGGQGGALKPASRTRRQPKVRGIADCDAIAIRRVNAFADFDFGLGNKCVRVLLAGEGFDMTLAGLAGVVAKPSMALFAGRCFPCALSDGHCVTLCFTHRTRHWI